MKVLTPIQKATDRLDSAILSLEATENPPATALFFRRKFNASKGDNID